MDDCIEWTLGKTAAGYGEMWKDGRPQYVHIVAYEAVHGPVPKGKEIHHTCENPGCINPAHLEALTRAEHSARHDRRREFCQRGHRMVSPNLYESGGRRWCRQCRLDAWHERHPHVRQEFCKRGHRLDGDNVYVYGNRRVCKACRRGDY